MYCIFQTCLLPLALFYSIPKKIFIFQTPLCSPWHYFTAYQQFILYNKLQFASQTLFYSIPQGRPRLHDFANPINSCMISFQNTSFILTKKALTAQCISTIFYLFYYLFYGDAFDSVLEISEVILGLFITNYKITKMDCYLIIYGNFLIMHNILIKIASKLSDLINVCTIKWHQLQLIQS